MANKTTIITLMFHRVYEPHLGYDPVQFEKYLQYLIQHFPIIIPGEHTTAPLAICLTFDDAYYDFYHYVFPLLKKYHIKALLGVPVKYIVDKTDLDPATRLSVPYPQGMEKDLHINKVPFCTWDELLEMTRSGLVIMASHGFAHGNLANPHTDIDQEIRFSKQILEQKLNTPIAHYIYPYGKMTRAVHNQVAQIYDYGIRIGSALNRGWNHPRKYIYRIDAENMWPQQQSIEQKQVRQWRVKYWINRLRGL